MSTKVSEDLITAAGLGDSFALKRLLDNGADLNSRDELGQTALMAAALNGRPRVVEALLKRRRHWWNPFTKGVSVNAKRNDGRSALMFASANCHLDVVKALLDAGAKVNVKDSGGYTALVLAAPPRERSSEVANLLIERGADVNEKPEDGWSALMWASNSGDLDTVEALLEKGAAVNLRENRDGRTALMWASDGGHVEVVKRLLKAGADVNEMSIGGGYPGRTALMWACHRGHVDVVKALIEKGADVNARTTSGRTALAVAEDSGVRAQLMRAGAKTRQNRVAGG